MIKGFERLELMRKELEEKGAFDIIDKLDPKQETPLTIKKDELLQSMIEREEEPFIKVERIDCVLSEKEAHELGTFFTKKELMELIEKKYPAIPNRKKLSEIIMQISEYGFIPVKPQRFIHCKNCGEPEDVSPITMFDYWDLKLKESYCKNCRKHFEETIQTNLIKRS